MIEVIHEGFADRVLAMRISGSVSRPDLDALAAVFEDKLTRHPRLRLYAEIQDLDGIAPAALIQDLRLSLKHFRDVEREALVADSGLWGLLARVGDLLPGIEVRAFSWEDQAEARTWIEA